MGFGLFSCAIDYWFSELGFDLTYLINNGMYFTVYCRFDLITTSTSNTILNIIILSAHVTINIKARVYTFSDFHSLW